MIVAETRQKQLIVAVEATAAMKPFWPTIVADYLDKIIRSFCSNELPGQKLSTPNVELALVSFSSEESYCAGLVQRSRWTQDVDVFLGWLSAMPFEGAGFSDAATAEGLSEALMMFLAVPSESQAQQSIECLRHCILVAASNPYHMPTPVDRPQLQNLVQGETIEAQNRNCLSDAETVAKSFSRCFVSLSVICPKQLPTLRAIYNAGKQNQLAPESSVDSLKDPHFLVLVSENFSEARSALSRPGVTHLAFIESPVEMDIASINSVPGPFPAIIPSANGSVMNQQPASGGTTSTENVKLERQSTSPQVQQTTASASQLAETKYIKAWEGNLVELRLGQPALLLNWKVIEILQLLRSKCMIIEHSLAANWPPTMQIVRLVSQSSMCKTEYAGKADFLEFRVLNQLGLLTQLQEMKLAAVIQLPSQTLLLSPDRPSHLIGMLFPSDMIEFNPQMPSQQQEQEQQRQQQLPPQPLQPQLQQQPLQQLEQIPLQQQLLQQLQIQPSQSLQQLIRAGFTSPYIYQSSGSTQMIPQGQVASQGGPSTEASMQLLQRRQQQLINSLKQQVQRQFSQPQQQLPQQPQLQQRPLLHLFQQQQLQQKPFQQLQQQQQQIPQQMVTNGLTQPYSNQGSVSQGQVSSQGRSTQSLNQLQQLRQQYFPLQQQVLAPQSELQLLQQRLERMQLQQQQQMKLQVELAAMATRKTTKATDSTVNGRNS